MTDQRRSPRKVANALCPFQIGPDNDAVVLNFSDTGLGFRTRSPVTQPGTIRFSFSENGEQVEASGELVWFDLSNRIGGLSFASLPREDREQIRNWADRMGAPRSTQADSEPAIPPSKEPSSPGLRPPESEAAPIPRSPLPGIALPQSAQPGFALFDDAGQRAPYAWDQEIPVANSPTKFFRGFLVGTIFSAIVAAILFFAYGNPANPLRMLVSEKIGAILGPQAAPTALPDVAVPPPPAASGSQPSSSVEAPAASGPPPASAQDSNSVPAPAKTATEPPLAHEPAAHAPESLPPKPADPGEDDLALAQRYLREKPGPEGSAAATRFLWDAVEKGNVKAEIALADLYARGDGVTKNCDQARVLLRAAAERGSSEASQELVQIIRKGCR